MSNKSGNKFWDDTRNRMTDYENEATVCAAARSVKTTGGGSLNKKLLESMKSAIQSDIQAAMQGETVESVENTQKNPVTFDECCGHNHADADQDALADDDADALLERRLQKMKEQMQKRREFLAQGHGEYTEISETDFLTTVTGSKRCIVHFYHPEFQACKILDMHLLKLCKAMIGCRFTKINATKCLFFTSKLNVKMLPTVVAFSDGVAKKRMTGFDEVGGSNEFPTGRLIGLLRRWGMAVDSVESEYMELCDGSIMDDESD